MSMKKQAIKKAPEHGGQGKMCSRVSSKGVQAAGHPHRKQAQEAPIIEPCGEVRGRVVKQTGQAFCRAVWGGFLGD